MVALVDTCGWTEWLTNGPLAECFEPHLRSTEGLVVPTCLQFELYPSFADALMYATARQCGAPLVTSDDHFEGLPEVEYLDKNGS